MANIPAPKEQSVLPEGVLPSQNLRATPADFGANLGASISQAGDVQADIALKRQAIANETTRVNAENDLMGQAQDLQNGNSDKGIVGYRTLVGQNAVDALPDYQQKLQDAYKQIREGLNPATQRMFDQTAFRIVRGSSDSMGAYGAQQQVVGAHQTARDRVALAQSGALTFADDPGGWDAHLSDVQTASMAGSRLLGLGPDATELQRQRDLSEVYEQRTKQLMLRDPVKAADFYHDNIGMVVPDKRYELERALKVTTDAQYAHTDGTDAYQSTIGRTSGSPAPTDLGAPTIKPLDDHRIQQIKAFVKNPTPWDDDINKAAKAYNVSANEIKLKIGMESGGNPKAVNPTSGATGLGQFTEAAAKTYGVSDRTDPVQSINAIAKYLAANGGTTGSDMSGADRAYYGGSPTAKGPDTDQYVENTRAARQAIMGGGAPPPLTAADLRSQEGNVLRAAGAAADLRRPGDSVYRDQVMNEAHSAWARDLQAKEGEDYANFSTVSGAVIKTKATALSDLPADMQQTVSQLTPDHLRSVDALMERNLRESNGEFTHSDPRAFNEARSRIYLPDGDPNRITNPGQLAAYIPGKDGKGGLNHTDFERLTKEVAQANTPEGNAFLKQTNGVKETARKMLLSSLSSQTLSHPELAEEGAYRFGHDLDQRIAAMRTAKKDPATLFDPSSPDYVLSPARVSAYAPTEASAAAAKAKGAAPAAAPRLPGETPAAYLARIGKS